jgi:hypothetical protein
MPGSFLPGRHYGDHPWYGEAVGEAHERRYLCPNRFAVELDGLLAAALDRQVRLNNIFGAHIF